MKKGYKIWMILFVLIFLTLSFKPSQAFLINEPTPQIQSDKNIYFVDEIIYLNASWNIYSSDNDDIGVKIILIDENPDLLAISSIIANSILVIDLPDDNGDQFFEIAVDITNLNLLESFKSLNVWILFVIFTYIQNEPSNSHVEKYEKIIQITKYMPTLYSNFTQFPIEFEITTQLPNRVVALEKPGIYYDDNVINYSISSQEVLYTSNLLNLNETGDFIINLSEFEEMAVGIYILKFDLRETHKFYSKKMIYFLTIEESELKIEFLNASIWSVNMLDSELEFRFQLKNTKNRTILIPNIFWEFHSNLNIISIEPSSNDYQIRVENPKSIGNYSIELWGEIENYRMDIGNFSLNIIHNSFNVVLNKPVFKNFNSLIFLVNVTNVSALNPENLLLKINLGGQWLKIDYNLTKFETNSTLLLEALWRDIQELSDFVIVEYYQFHLEFTGNEEFSPTSSNTANISCPIFADFYATPQIGSVGDPIQFFFTGISENEIDLFFNWDFGDGNNSTEKNPRHIFWLEGSFSISLNITDNQGKSDTVFQSSYILIYYDLKPSAIFSANDSKIIEGDVVKFQFLGDLGNDPVLIFWDFGDGTNSSVLEPSHIYNQNGSYSVRLSIRDWDGDEDNCYIKNCITVEKDIQSSANFSSSAPKSNILPLSASLGSTILVGVIVYLKKTKIIRKSTKRIRGKKITV